MMERCNLRAIPLMASSQGRPHQSSPTPHRELVFTSPSQAGEKHFLTVSVRDNEANSLTRMLKVRHLHVPQCGEDEGQFHHNQQNWHPNILFTSVRRRS